MSNPLLNAMASNSNPQMHDGMGNMLQAFQQFRATFSGDPQQQVQALLNSGRMSQQQYNQLAQMANQLVGILK